ncbi:hypothetical protein [Gloeocapsopsis dulcis]|uniref:Polyketide cyclase n=1 Tax=Gloeocapsopsis dulcis AAB1 = 1H9 TaxID=1433147 RepID=A0A6N8FZ85_9CHRO|nr:hypothetical protein [Gloeocapsopsis dulcis]MUL37206.1 hypothetical protein [Gloeocapsopsis dulcis AAB1 = 1H9]WNN90183.1 hypothetical protein P0S91_03530 [Gloeocapsopsis dulcis]
MVINTRDIAYNWGSTPEERLMPFPCDQYMENSDEAYFRAINVEAPIEILFRWLCQLKVGSYSYDWIDRLERRFFPVQDSISNPPNPNQLIPGVENLALGQRVMGVFKLVEFEQNRHLTIIMDDERAITMFGNIAASYVVSAISENTCRLILKGHIRYPRNSVWSLMRYFLPWGDLVMMRQQFLRLKSLAECSCEVTI